MRRSLVLLFFLTLLVCTIINPIASREGTIRVAQGNIYEGFFKEPFEVVVFIFKDGEAFAFTNYLEHRVWLPLGFLEEFFEKRDRRIEDIETVIHSHRIPTSFTLSNLRYYHRLKRRGFKGHFKIYYPFSKEVREIEE